MNFCGKGKQSPLLDVMTFIQHELEGSGSCIGYSAMHQRCIRNGSMVSQVIITQIMKYLNPIVNMRRKRTLRCRYIIAWVQIAFGIWMDMTS